MENKDIARLEKKAVSMEKQLIGELFLMKDLNDILTFTQTYISNYLPILLYSIKNFEADQIAKLMNSSILIDRLLECRMSDYVQRRIVCNVQEFLDQNKVEDAAIFRLINNQSLIEKKNLSSSLLFMFSFIRGALFSVYCNKKLYLNYGIGWNNLLIHFIDNPHLIYLLEQKDIDVAREQLDFIKKDLSKKEGELEKEITSALINQGVCSQEKASEVNIYFVALKVDWLKSNSLLSFCEFLKTGDKKHLKKAINFSEVLKDTFLSDDTDYQSTSFREKISFPGPSLDIKNIIGDLTQYKKISKIFNYVAYFETDQKQFVLVFPTSLSFYFSRSLCIEGGGPLIEDEDFLLNNYETGCFSILDYIKNVEQPSKTDFYRKWCNIHDDFLKYDEYGISKKLITDCMEKANLTGELATKLDRSMNKSRIISNSMALSMLAVLNSYLEAKGISKLPDYTTTTVPLLMEILLQTVYKSGYDKLFESLTEDDTNILGFAEQEEYNSYQKLEKQIECLEISSGEMADFLNLEGLKDIHDTNFRLRELIMSSKNVDAINSELKKIYDSLKD